MAHSLNKCNSTHLFEDNQANLEKAVEDLSEMVDKPIEPSKITEIKMDMQNKLNFVQKRSEIIMKDTLMGYIEVSVVAIGCCDRNWKCKLRR